MVPSRFEYELIGVGAPATRGVVVRTAPSEELRDIRPREKSVCDFSAGGASGCSRCLRVTRPPVQPPPKEHSARQKAWSRLYFGSVKSSVTTLRRGSACYTVAS